MLNLFKLFIRRKKYNLEKVFTPTSYAIINYARRDTLEKRLIKELKTPGKQIIIYGHSGSGKSTLINNVLRQEKINSITTSCVKGTTVEQLLLNAFDALDIYYTDKKSSGTKVTISSDIKAEYCTISSQIHSAIEKSETVEQKRILPPQLNAQRLRDFLGQANCIWIIEDFHKVDGEEKVKLSQVLKLFVDVANKYNALKIIAIGAAGTAREIVEYDTELSNRVSEILVPLLDDNELKQIIINGTKELNVKFDVLLTDKIVKYSNHLGTITHQLAFNVCYNNSISKTVNRTVYFGDSEIIKSVESFVEDKADTFKELYDRITAQRKGRYQNVELILKSLIELNKEDVSHHELLEQVWKHEKEYPPANLSAYLKKLTTTDTDEVLRLDMASAKYTFSDPFFKAYVGMKVGNNSISQNNELYNIYVSLENLENSSANITYTIEFKNQKTTPHVRHGSL